MKPNFFINCTSIEDVKQLYKKLAMLHHPDKGGDTLTMQQINIEYQQILKDKSFSFDNEEQEKDFIIYPEVISKLIVLDQVLIELIGSWIWVSVYSGLIDPSFRVIDPSAGGNNPEGRSLLSMQ
jgi:preprotein translocase subunit Sec63